MNIIFSQPLDQGRAAPGSVCNQKVSPSSTRTTRARRDPWASRERGRVPSAAGRSKYWVVSECNQVRRSGPVDRDHLAVRQVDESVAGLSVRCSRRTTRSGPRRRRRCRRRRPRRAGREAGCLSLFPLTSSEAGPEHCQMPHVNSEVVVGAQPLGSRAPPQGQPTRPSRNSGTSGGSARGRRPSGTSGPRSLRCACRTRPSSSSTSSVR